MKRVICSSCTSLSNAISSLFNVSKQAADIVARWYMYEDTLDGFDSLEDVIDYIMR